MCDICITITNYCENKYLAFATIHKSITIFRLQQYIKEIFQSIVKNNSDTTALICVVYDFNNDHSNVIIIQQEIVANVKKSIEKIASSDLLDPLPFYTIDSDSVPDIMAHSISRNDFGTSDIYKELYNMVAKSELPVTIYYCNKNLKK